MKKFNILAVRGLSIADSFTWRGSYFIEPQETLQDAINAALVERNERGGKYGFVIYENGAEVGAMYSGSVGEFIKRSKY